MKPDCCPLSEEERAREVFKFALIGRRLRSDMSGDELLANPMPCGYYTLGSGKDCRTICGADDAEDE